MQLFHMAYCSQIHRFFRLDLVLASQREISNRSFNNKLTSLIFIVFHCTKQYKLSKLTTVPS